MLSRAKLTTLRYLVQSPTCPPAPHGGRFLWQQVLLPLHPPKGGQTGWKQGGLEKQMEQRASLNLQFPADISQPLYVTIILCLAPTGTLLIFPSLSFCSTQEHILSFPQSAITANQEGKQIILSVSVRAAQFTSRNSSGFFHHYHVTNVVINKATPETCSQILLRFSLVQIWNM